jgi:hypothetical protein
MTFLQSQFPKEAVRTGQLSTVRLLLDHGSDVKVQNKLPGGSVLDLALQYLDQNHEVVKVLKSHGDFAVASEEEKEEADHIEL